MAHPPPPSALYTPTFFLALLTTLLLCATLRALSILPSHSAKPRPRAPGTRTRVVIVLGSGGHTQEMLYLLRDLDPGRYTHRTWVVSSGDAFSAGRAVAFESEIEHRVGKGMGRQNVGPGSYDVQIVPRARKIHQSLLTTPASSLRCLWACFGPLLSSSSSSSSASTNSTPAAADLPELIITNGPATACILVLAALLLKFFDVRGAQSRGKCRTVYAESFARVKTLSLSGKLLVRVVDRFLVQWEELEGAGGGRAEFVGVLV
ncbi:Alg14-domain-containing protein [Paraphaeosphaeria sporulosa]|uniref:UDP-N-acetylglucosamine transferase subunit ALG14 n=1 Tax=Paraphaeosphaeria sporulosa TaxID=1460663 RepID=A0A177CLE3_9PLEO|nr:Alg14-domain-containing protein [Paraphaeosphaeria sporulosa]OAG07688.1 Alg14-domain-containing protein [Paraphaeosphaeria sporulosa]